MRPLIKASVDSRALVALITIIVGVFGGVALGALPRELLPPVESPEVAVITEYDGASPDVVDKDVSAVMEKAVRAVPGVTSTTTTSASGLSVVFVSFATGTDTSSAVQQVQREVDSTRKALPESSKSRVRAGSIDDLPVVQAAVTSMSDAQPSAGVRAAMIAEVNKVDGVRSASFIGGVSEEIRLVPRPNDMRRQGVTAATIAAALRTAGKTSSTGEMRSDGKEMPIEAGRVFASPEDVAAVPLLNASGRTIKIADVAAVSIADAPPANVREGRRQACVAPLGREDPGGQHRPGRRSRPVSAGRATG
ncbi:efflux RND transporter permease subunit [Microbacterium sp.]|uniref:efflux RND transporter permease subunit n=1 Tax=Microbacterium sp. TaxID=51671 RepID=UPI0033405087